MKTRQTQQLFNLDNHVACGPLIWYLCKSASEGLYRGSNGSSIAMADMASSPNLNLSGKVKGRNLGMHVLYPQSANNRAVLTLRIIPNFFI